MGDTDTSRRFDVFVSYNTSDRVAVEQIARELAARGLSVFIDRWELVPGQSWPEVLERRIADCRSAAVVLGPAGVGSWQHREQYLALDRQSRDSRFRVIPVLLPGADPALGFLGLNTWIDLRQGIDDPHALDLLAGAVRGESPRGLAEESRRAATDVCPYRGLEVFREEDAPFFFGRGAFTRRLLRQIEAHRFVAVVGASGSGKSSVVRAGLVPMLRHGTGGAVWDVLTLTPGAEPLAALARTLDPPAATGLTAARRQINAAVQDLRSGDVTLKQLVADHLARQPGTERLLLVVDQFEELATLAEDRTDAGRFVDLLLEASTPGGAATVLITLRSDFYTQIVQRRDLNDRLQDAVVHIGPLSRTAPEGEISELETIVRRPAEAVGLGFEDGLVARIVADVGDEPGNLPLLEYLLSELWRQRAGGALTHRAYDGLGGVQGAIASRADTTYSQLTPAEQQAARRLFLSLIRPGEGRQDTRAPAPFPDDDHEAQVARRFAGPGVRLLVTDADELRGRFLQVSHEALIHGWSRLRRWIEQNRDTLRARDRVSERMRRWREKDRPDDLLLPPGLELEEGRSLLDSDTDVAIDGLRGYIQASIAADAARRRRRRALAGAVAFAGILLLAATGWQWREAEDARDRAEQERDLAIARQLNAAAAGVLAENPGETGLAAMVAVESQQRRNTPEANALLREVLALTPLEAPLVDFPWAYGTVQLSADGRVQVFENRDFRNLGGNETSAASSVMRLNRADLSPIGSRRFGGEMRPLLSPDGRWLVSAGLGRRLLITDLDAGNDVVDEATRSATVAVFGPNSSMLYVARPTGDIEVRSAPDWAVTRRLAFPVAAARNVDLQIGIGADGERLFVVDNRRGAFMVPTDGSDVSRLAIEVDEFRPWFASDHLSSGIVSPVRPLALTRQADGTSRLWDLGTGRERLGFVDEGRAAAAAFSPDGRTVATADSEGTVSLRDLADGTVRHRWRHRGDWDRDEDRVNVLAFSVDGRLLASAGADGAVMVWSVEAGLPWHRFDLGAPVTALAADPADGTLLAGTEQGRLARLDLRHRMVAVQRTVDGAVTRIEAAERGRIVAVGVRETGPRSSWDDISFVERASGRELSHVSFNGELRSQRISPDGRRFAAFDPARDRVIVWDTGSGQVLFEVAGRAAPVAFAPDSARLLLHDGVGALRVLDAATGKPLFELGEPGGISRVFGEAHADTAITLGLDRSLRGWDLATGESRWHTVPDQPGVRVTTSADGGTFAYYSDTDQAIRVFESETGRPLGSINTVRPTRGFALGDDGSRLLTIHAAQASGGGGNRAYEVDLWDVATATRLQRRQVHAQHLFSQPVGGAHLALLGRSTGGEGPTSWLELMDWKTGRVAWSLSVGHPAPFSVVYLDRDGDLVLIEGPSSPQDPPSRQMRSLQTGDLGWEEPGSSLRAATGIPHSDLVAFADASALDRNSDVIRLLSRLTGEERRRVDAGGHARHLAATADGSRVVAAVEGERWRGVRVWRVDDGRLVREIELDANPKAVLPLRDPDRIAVEDFANKLRVFDLASGRPLQRIAHTRSADTVATAAAADLAVTAAGASLRVWDTRRGREVAQRTTQGDASSVAISRDGSRVAYLAERPHTTEAGTEFSAVVLWSAQRDGPPVPLPVEGVDEITFDPSGRYLALRGKDSFVRLVDTGTLRTVRTQRPLRNGKIDQLAFAAEGSILLMRETGRYRDGVGTTDRHSLRAFDIAKDRELARVDMGYRMLPLPNAPGVLYQDVHGRWRSTDLYSRGLDPALVDAEPDSLAAAPGSPRVLAASYRGRTLVLDPGEGRTTTLATGDGPFNVLHAAMDAGGRYVALSLREREWREDSTGLVIVFDAGDGTELARLETARPMWNAAFVDGGDALVVSELRSHLPTKPDHLLVHWDWRSGEQRTLEQGNPVGHVAVSHDGRVFATAEGSWDSDREGPVGTLQLRIWSGANGAERVRVPLGFNPSAVVLSPDGRYAAVNGGSGVLLFSAEDGTELAAFRNVATSGMQTAADFAVDTHARVIVGHGSLGFASGGDVLTIALTNGVLLYDIPTRSTRRLAGGEPVERVVVSADGRLLALQGERLLSVWDVAAGDALVRAELPGIKGLVFGGEDGRQLFAVHDGRILRLRWQPGELRSLACELFGDGDWGRGRARITQGVGEPPCEAEG